MLIIYNGVGVYFATEWLGYSVLAWLGYALFASMIILLSEGKKAQRVLCCIVFSLYQYLSPFDAGADKFLFTNMMLNINIMSTFKHYERAHAIDAALYCLGAGLYYLISCSPVAIVKTLPLTKRLSFLLIGVALIFGLSEISKQVEHLRTAAANVE